MKGIYALAISMNKNIVVSVGALNEVAFEKGIYVYVGSAQSGIEKRTARYLTRIKRRFWHIDYLLEAEGVNILKVFRREGPRLEECRVARRLGRMGVIVDGFGSSDCDCNGHLIKVGSYGFLNEWMEELSL